MKKKAKLIATLSSLGLALAMMVFAVYAATSVTFKVTTNVSFEATKHVQATILAMHTGALEDAPTDADYNTNDVTGANQTINVDENGNTTGTITDVVFGARELTASNNHYGYKIEITNNDNENDLPIAVTLPEQTGTGYEVTWSEMPTSIDRNGGKVVITCHIEIKDLAGNSVTVKNEDMALDIMLGEEEAPAPTLEYLAFELVEDTENGNYYKVAIDEDKINGVSTYSASLLSETEFDGNIVIPAYKDGFPVKEIYALNSHETRLPNVTSVILPETIEKIGRYAFARTSITEINLPKNLKTIESYAFTWNYYISSITIPSSVTTIGYQVFNWCGGLVEIINKSSLNITSGSIKQTEYEGGTLIAVHNGDKSLVYNIDGVNYIDYDGEVYACGISNPNVTHIKIKEGTTEINHGAFMYANSLVSVELPNSVKYIGCGVFRECINLQSINFPHGLLDIGSYSFYSCSGLTSIVLPDSMVDAGESVFVGCGVVIYFESTERPGSSDSFFSKYYLAGQWHYDAEGNPVPNA